MLNPRNAGRKKKLTDEQLRELEARRARGETLTSLAAQYGLSRQAVYQRMKQMQSADPVWQMDYYVDEELISVIQADPDRQLLRVVHYTEEISKRAFGWNENPAWEDLGSFLEQILLRQKTSGKVQPFPMDLVCEDVPSRRFDLSDFAVYDDSVVKVHPPSGADSVPSFSFTRKDILFTRTDTDGFQMKALSQDRMWFVKSQAVFAGKRMNDWQVEAIASDLCRQLGIGHVEQNPCRFFYNGRSYMGVYSRNFELDGYSFLSFERLLERMGRSSRDEEFIRLSSADKLRWCALRLSEAGNLPTDKTTRYMLDLALLDCLVGNVDRHTHNFGLFYHAGRDRYEIPLIFDNGMGLFEHDYYNDDYASFEDAMRTVYIEPYGEDPFDLIRILMQDFQLFIRYPSLQSIRYADFPVSEYAREYQRRMLQILAG